MAKRYHSTKKFARIDALNKSIDDGDVQERGAAIRAKSKMNDTWNKRRSTNTTGFWRKEQAYA